MGNWFANPARQRGLLYAALLVGLLAARIPVGRAAWTGTAELHTSLETAVTVLALVIGAMALVHYSSHKSGAYLTLGLGFLAAGVVNGYHAVLTSPLCAACRLLHFSPPFSPWPERSAGLMLCILFAFALAAHWRQGEWKTDGFTSSLVLFLMVEAISQTSYLTFSAQPFDSLHTAAHVLKILSYVIVLTGLFHSILSTFRRASAAVGSLTRANESYAAEVERRERVEGELQQSREELEARVVARTADLAEQGGLSALASEIAILLTQGDDVPETLQRAAQLIVHFLEAAFVRVWTLNQAGNVLELQASAGMYTHLDGAHARVPVGQFKIGRIAREGQPHLTNDVQADSWVSDPEWARRERMIAFAGYPLMVGDSVVGVVAAFAHRPLSKAAYQTFGSLAGSIAQFLGRKRTEVALQDSEARVRLLLDSTAEAVYGIDLSGNCTLANRSCLRMLGYERAQDMLGRNIHDLIHHSYADGRPHPASECRILSAFERGEGTHADNEVLWRADGTSFPAEYWSYPVRKNGRSSTLPNGNASKTACAHRRNGSGLRRKTPAI
jgi:PAS domain S-box-containing protein